MMFRHNQCCREITFILNRLYRDNRDILNYSLSIIAWLLNVGVNSYGYHEGYGIGIRVLTLNVLATTDDFMITKPSKVPYGRHWMAQFFFSYMIACAIFASSLSAEINFRKYNPLLWWRNHESYVPTIC